MNVVERIQTRAAERREQRATSRLSTVERYCDLLSGDKPSQKSVDELESIGRGLGYSIDDMVADAEIVLESRGLTEKLKAFGIEELRTKVQEAALASNDFRTAETERRVADRAEQATLGGELARLQGEVACHSRTANKLATLRRKNWKLFGEPEPTTDEPGFSITYADPEPGEGIAGVNAPAKEPEPEPEPHRGIPGVNEIDASGEPVSV